MEEGVNDRKDKNNENTDEEKEAYERTYSEITTISEGKGVIDERGGKDVDLDEFDESTCSDDNFYDFSDVG